MITNLRMELFEALIATDNIYRPWCRWSSRMSPRRRSTGPGPGPRTACSPAPAGAPTRGCAAASGAAETSTYNVFLTNIFHCDFSLKKKIVSQSGNRNTRNGKIRNERKSLSVTGAAEWKEHDQDENDDG